jgi:hypothetical protein
MAEYGEWVRKGAVLSEPKKSNSCTFDVQIFDKPWVIGGLSVNGSGPATRSLTDLLCPTNSLSVWAGRR